MKIKTRIQIGVILNTVLVITVGLTIFIAVQLMNADKKEKRTISQIVKGVAELKIITHEYLLHHEKRTKMQWKSRYKSLTKLLTSTDFRSPEKKIIFDKICHNHAQVKAVFLKLVAGHDKKLSFYQTNNSTFRELENRLVSQLLVKSQVMVSSAFQLYGKIDADLEIVEARARVLIVFFLVLLILITTAVSIWIYSSVVTPIMELERGVQKIGDGNLGHTVSTEAKDEIGHLSRAFDQMRKKLSNTLIDLVSSKNYVDNIIKSMPDTLIVVYPDTKIKYVNQATLNLLGYEELELIGNPIENILKTDEQVLLQEMGIEELIKKDFIQGVERAYLAKDGTRVPVLFSGSIMRDEEDKILGVVCVAQDITDRKKAEEQIKTSLKEKEVLLKEVHHRVKNNMAIVSSFLNLQMARIKDEEHLKSFVESRDRVHTMASIHEKLYQSENLSSINFKEFIHDLSNSLMYSYRMHHEHIKVDLDANDIFLDIDKAIPCGLILNELLANAFKYAFSERRRGRVHISFVENSDNNFVLIVSDDGSGFPKEINFRETESLGMQLVTALTYQLKGTIALKGDHGTTFQITFPRS